MARRIRRGMAGGCRNGAQLWRRFRLAGFGGSMRVVTEWATRQWRAEMAPHGGPRKSPSARKIVRMMRTARDHLSKENALTAATIKATVPRLAAAHALIDRFQTTVRRGA